MIEQDRCRIRIDAPPVDGKANKRLLTIVADQCGIRKTAVTLLKGTSGRNKQLLIEGLDATQVFAKLADRTQKDNLAKNKLFRKR